jgi:GNAT superfamily N-acetyltransferase
MAITYQVEPWEAYFPECQALWVQHWCEVALDQAAVPLDPDLERYQAYADAGHLFILSMRDAGKLVGYFVGIVSGHLHYKSTRMCFTDLFYLLPAYRKGLAGVRLFREAETALRARGVRRIQTATKLHAHLDMSRLLERLGYTRVEAAYHKLLEESPWSLSPGQPRPHLEP